ncbi:hypothetical protein FRC09_007472 [Ceratobasidium sp. 395]|nr:hypothetical protein FRC09_007472 [Ceratobasidium sp. 395]
MRFSSLVFLFTVVSSLESILAALDASTGKPRSCKKLRVRKEWRYLTDTQKRAYINAVKASFFLRSQPVFSSVDRVYQCLSNLPHSSDLKPTYATPNIPAFNPNSSKYDDFVYAHISSNIKDHFTAIFLPWHRWYLHTFEKTLQEKCNYTGTLPFWDWSKGIRIYMLLSYRPLLNAKNPNIDANSGIPDSPIFNSSETHGLGTFGTASNNYTVTDGAFANITRAYPSPHYVQRNFTATASPFDHQVFPFAFLYPNLLATDTLTPEKVQAVVKGTPGNYTAMAYAIDGIRAQGMHNAAHLMMTPGDMSSPLWSPNDPIFWSHHANIDCIWARWQAHNRSTNQYAFGGGLTQNLTDYDQYAVGAPPEASLSSKLPTEGLSGPVTVKEVMDTRNNYLCYKCLAG